MSYIANNRFVLVPKNDTEPYNKEMRIGFATMERLSYDSIVISDLVTIYKAELVGESLPEWIYIPENREFGEVVSLGHIRENKELDCDQWYRKDPLVDNLYWLTSSYRNPVSEPVLNNF